MSISTKHRGGAWRARTALAGGITLGIASAVVAGMPAAQAINSNPPTGPGNIEVFPKRDMVAIEGYGEYAGRTAEIKVLRNGNVIGSARGTVDGTGFLEVNHPGGACWGAGTNLQVTPDIKGNDEIRVEFLGTGTPNKWDGAVTQDVEVTRVDKLVDAKELRVSGTFGPRVDMPGTDLTADPGKFGVEIVNPDMRGGTSAVGERAIGWPIEVGETTAGYTVTGGITSGAEGSGGTFEVVYTFEQATDLDLAEAGEVVGLGWQADAPPELGIEAMYGMTLYEFHEASGPGMGGCPAGPTQMRPEAPTVFTGKGAGDGRIAVTWEAATTAPEAPPITGYSVTAVRSVTEDENGAAEVGATIRVAADRRSAVLRGLDPGEIYDVEIAARSTAGPSSPAVMRVRASAHLVPEATASTPAQPDADGRYQPLVTTAANDLGVQLDPVPGLIDAEIHYTVNNSRPTLDSPTFVPGVSESLQIRDDTTVRWIVVDGGNIVGPVGSKLFDIAEAANEVPVISRTVPAPVSGAVDVTFNRLGDETVTAYRVRTYAGDSVDAATGERVGLPVTVAQPTDTTVTEVSRRVLGLTNGTPYKFTVAARYGTVWTGESALSEAVAPEGAPKANAGEDQSVLRGRQFTIDGSGSVKATSYQWTQIRPGSTANNGFPQDPALDLNAVQAGMQSQSVAGTDPAMGLTMPLLTTPTSDHTFLFRLTTKHTDGTTKSDLVEIKAQADAITAEEVRWRAGDEIGGTGSQENAVLTLHNGSATGPIIDRVVVTNGEWSFAGGAPALLDGRIYVWSDYGYAGTITTTN